MRSLYQLHKAFAMRARPDKPRGAPEKGESNAGVARSILDAMERMREQRVKQLASRVVASALGLGGHWKEVQVALRGADGKLLRDARGIPQTRSKRIWQEEQSRKYAPCHAVVIESLTHYRPDELRTRRENRMLMQWASAKVHRYLQEECELYGLHLREVLPKYTSRQCSRTGLPGIRCDDVPVQEFLTAPWWNKAINAARKKLAEKNSADAEARLLVELHDKWNQAPQGEREGKTVRVPRQGGDLFVAAPPDGRTCTISGPRQERRAIQADLNAAANIGLRALLDPDFSGRWWYVSCRDSDGTPLTEKVKGSACFGVDIGKFGALRKPLGVKGVDDKQATKARRSAGKGKEVTNFWSDPNAHELRSAARGGVWYETQVYWRRVKKRVIDGVLREFNGLPKPAD